MLDPSAPDITDVQRTIWLWAVRELAPWRIKPIGKAQAEAACNKLAERVVRVVAFRIFNGRVSILEKQAHQGDPRLGGYLQRAARYQELFQEAVDLWCPDLDLTLCMSVGDTPHADPFFPVFCFQKVEGAREVLLPDIDFLINKFYVDEHYTDPLAYDQKFMRAFFIGAITGGRVTADAIRSLSLPRLQAAAHFHQDPDVEFRLAARGEFESDEVRQMAEQLPFCRGGTANWWEQRVNRFLISMDGNGATCSRVVIALMSNSVLLKYASPNVLYYFDGLSKWSHFIPIDSHDDVKAMVELERESPGILSQVALHGREFAEAYLTRRNVVFYTAAVLSLYSRCFERWETVAQSAPLTPLTKQDAPAKLPLQLTTGRNWTIIAHIQVHGDTRGKPGEWVGFPRSGRRIEGFSIGQGLDVPDFELRYCATLANGTVSPWARSGTFCGTRGKGLALAGFCIELHGNATNGFDLHYEARFVDGSVIGPVESGEMCVSPIRSALEAFRITLTSHEEA